MATLLLGIGDMSYETEIHGSIFNDMVYGDIKYPCGALVYGWECSTFKEAGEKVARFIENHPFVPHKECDSEYCNEEME